MGAAQRHVFLTGGTGYLGSRLIPALLERRHAVRALTRAQAASTLPAGCPAIVGDPLQSSTFAQHVPPADTFVHLVGVSRPAPWKAKQFRMVDLPSVQASLAAARSAVISHLVYISVAQPAPVMKAYLQVRAECEALIRTSGLHATILRPWYILGPGHYWPMALLPVYWLMERLPATRDSARRLGLVTLKQMIDALVWVIEHPPLSQSLLSQGSGQGEERGESEGIIRVMDVGRIRSTLPET